MSTLPVWAMNVQAGDGCRLTVPPCACDGDVDVRAPWAVLKLVPPYDGGCSVARRVRWRGNRGSGGRRKWGEGDVW